MTDQRLGETKPEAMPLIGVGLCGRCASAVRQAAKEMRDDPQSAGERRMGIRRYTYLALCESCIVGIDALAGHLEPAMARMIAYARRRARRKGARRGK